MDPSFACCPICRAGPPRTRYQLSDYRVAACPDCATWFNPDFPPGDSIRETFDEAYYLGVQREAFEAQLLDYRNDPSLRPFRAGLGQLARVSGGRGRLLDVGSAFGTFLRCADRAGWTPEGVEVSRFAAEQTRSRFGYPVFTGQLADASLDAGRYDAVTFWDVIEHVPWPADDLQRAHHLLRPGGALLLTTDLVDSLIVDIGRALYHVTGGRIGYGVRRFLIPYNRTFFTVASLRRLLERCGFEVLATRRMDYPIAKIKLAPPERALVLLLYLAGHALQRQSQVSVLARRRG